MAALVVLLLAVPADDAASVTVSVDWSGVTDKVIEACELSGFESLIMQQVIDGGFALIAERSAADIRATIRVAAGSFHLSARRGDVDVETTVPIPDACEGSIQLDLMHELLALLRALPTPAAVDPLSPPQPAPERITEPVPKPAPPPIAHPPQPGWPVAVSATVVFAGSPRPLFGASGALQLRMWPWLWLDAGVEASAMVWGGVFIAEPALSTGLSIPVIEVGGSSITIGAELAVLAHVYESDTTGGAFFDMRFGLPLRWGDFITVEITPFLRLGRYGHVLDTGLEYDSDYWGMLGRVGLVLGNL